MLKEEIKSLLEKVAFLVVLKEEIRADGNVLHGRFVLALMLSSYGKVHYRAR